MTYQVSFKGQVIEVASQQDMLDLMTMLQTQAAELDALQAKYNCAMVDIGKLHALVVSCHHESKTALADELIGVVSGGDVSAPLSTVESVSMDMLHIGATENARLLDVLGILLAGIEDYLKGEGRAVSTLHLYGPADAWFKCAIEAARAEFPLPFESATESEHAPGRLEPLDPTKAKKS